MDIFRDSRSERRFAPERTFDPKTVERIIEKAGMAPSGLNKQPWLYCIVSNPELRSAIREKCEDVETAFYNKLNSSVKKEFNEMGCRIKKPFLSDAPLLICVFSDNSAPYHIESTWLSIAWFFLAAAEEGLATLTYTPDDLSFLNDLLGMEKRYEPQVILPLGYGLTKSPKSRKKGSEIMRKYG